MFYLIISGFRKLDSEFESTVILVNFYSCINLQHIKTRYIEKFHHIAGDGFTLLQTYFRSPRQLRKYKSRASGKRKSAVKKNSKNSM